MRELHDELTALHVDWPETPDLAGAVAERLAAAPAAAAPRRRRPALRYALAALAAAFALTLAVSPAARSAVLELLGLESVRVERREPQAPPPRPGRLGAGLGLGQAVTLDAARRSASYLSLPRASGLGRPDAVYVSAPGIALVYGARPGYARARTTGAALLVQELPARVGDLIGKSVGGGARLERLRVDGDPAYFITGAHGFAFLIGHQVDFEDQRIAGNTLLVERADGLLIRVEGAIARDRAVAVARSIP